MRILPMPAAFSLPVCTPALTRSSQSSGAPGQAAQGGHGPIMGPGQGKGELPAVGRVDVGALPDQVQLEVLACCPAGPDPANGSRTVSPRPQTRASTYSITAGGLE